MKEAKKAIGHMREMNSYGQLFTIPQTPYDREFLLSVDRKTKGDVDVKYGLIVDYDWQCNTVANGFIKTIIGNLAYILKTNPSRGIGLNFFEVFTAKATIKKNDKAEKEGNINVLFEPGDIAYNLIENGPPEEVIQISPLEEFLSKNEEENIFYAKLEHQARYDLAYINGVILPESAKLIVLAVTKTFFENIYTEILYRLAAMDKEAGEDSAEEKLVSVNFNDNIEIHGVMKDGKISIYMRPGKDAKLLIKSDETTENTMGED